MKKLGLVGRNVTLKLMVRAENAPEETAKYNGHGVCDNMSRSAQLRLPTNNSDIIYKEVLGLVRQCKAAPNDLRGVGITVSKLQSEAGSKSSANSSILKFVKPKLVNNTSASTSGSSFSSPISSNPVHVATKEATSEEFPSQIDPDILYNLPQDIREEILNSSKLKSNSDSVIICDKNNDSNTLDLDPDILDQLPPDIRAELEARSNVKTSISDIISNPAETASNNDDKLSSSDVNDIKQSTSTRDINLPSTSKTSSLENKFDTMDVCLESDNSNSCSDLVNISFSQVDQSVLSQLPSELQFELNRHFAKDKNKTTLQNISRSAIDEIMSSSNLEQPTKTSPSKTTRSKRGRKKCSDSETINNKTQSSVSPKKQTISQLLQHSDSEVSTQDNIELDDNNSVDMDVVNFLPDYNMADFEAQIMENYERDDDQDTTLSASTVEEQDEEDDTDSNVSETEIKVFELDICPSFCGKSKIEDLRPLLKEWIFSSYIPQDDDISLFEQFLADLIHDWRSDLVQARNVETQEVTVKYCNTYFHL